MNKLLIKDLKIVLEEEVILGDILIIDGIIEKISSENIDFKYEDLEILDGKGDILIPGFIDVHIHGANGADTMDGKKKSFEIISKFIVKKGVTNFLPTSLSSSKEDLKNILKIAAEVQNKDIGGANIFGVHMEGPYFDVEYKGAQDKKYIKKLSLESLREFVNIKKDLIKVVSLSPNTIEAYEGIKYLKENEIISSVGHSAASYDEVIKGVEYGLSHSTHTYNGMKGLNHREPGVVGAVLSSDKINAEIIFDKVHVHEAAVDILIKAKGIEKVICITDAMSATGLEDGDYKLGELDVYVKNNEARLKSNNSLAGSVLTMDKAFKNLISLGYSIFEAVKMTSTNAAKEFSLNTGEIKIGKQADLVILGENYLPKATIVKGKIKFNEIN